MDDDTTPRGKLAAGLGGLDSAKVAGLLVLGSLLVLGGMRRGFGGVKVSLGD